MSNLIWNFDCTRETSGVTSQPEKKKDKKLEKNREHSSVHTRQFLECYSQRELGVPIVKTLEHQCDIYSFVKI